MHLIPLLIIIPLLAVFLIAAFSRRKQRIAEVIVICVFSILQAIYVYLILLIKTLKILIYPLGGCL